MSQGRPDLSITIVSFNTRDLTLQCIRSIYDQTKGVSVEVWVVDNDSSDGSPEAVEREFPQVHSIRNKDNRGLAAATNQGLEGSTGRYVLALNSDTLLRSDAFTALVRFMDDHPEVGGATPKLVLPDGGKHPTFCGAGDSLKWALQDALGPLSEDVSDAAPRTRDGAEMDLGVTQEVPCVIWGTSFIVRREVYDAIGGQDPAFFVYGEDVDWAKRITKAGWKLYYVSEAEVIHYGGQSTKQASAKMQAQLAKSKCRLIGKHEGPLAGVVLRSAHALICGIRLSKWLVLYALRPGSRDKARLRIGEMWSIIRAVLTY